MIVYGASVQAAVRRRAQREGLQLHVASYGGSGTVFTSEWLNKRRRVQTQGWHALLNHYAVPIDCGVPRLCLMADPPTAHASVIRRGLAENVTRHLHGGQYGRCQIEGMVEFFHRWTGLLRGEHPGSLFIFAKYETLHDHLDELGQLLGLSFAAFPKRKPRKSRLMATADPRLIDLRDRFNALPAFAASAAS
jgi:hypothetical protein